MLINSLTMTFASEIKIRKPCIHTNPEGVRKRHSLYSEYYTRQGKIRLLRLPISILDRYIDREIDEDVSEGVAS